MKSNFNFENDFQIMEDTIENLYNYANTGWGQEELTITDREIRALKEGKIIGNHDGEYTHIIRYKEGN